MATSAPGAPPAREPLPPGQVWGKKFVIYAAMGVQHVDASKWKLEVTGLVKTPLTFGYRELVTLPMRSYSKSFHCLLPGGMVFARPEPIRIEDVREGTEVVGDDGLLHAVTKVIRRRHSGPIVGIKASHLPSEKMTPDHPVWSVRGRSGRGKPTSKRTLTTLAQGWEPGWVRADELRIGDHVFFPKYRHVSPRREVVCEDHAFAIDEKLGKLLGRYVSKGFPAGGHDRASGLSPAGEVERLLEDAMRVRVGTHSDASRAGVTLVTTSTKVGGLRRILGGWCGTSAAQMRIPDFIMDARQSVLREFLVSCLKGGGYPGQSSGEGAEGLIEFTTSSKTFAYQLLQALSKLEIPGRLIDRSGSAPHGFSVRVRGPRIGNLLPGIRALPRVDESDYQETDGGFYYPITGIWAEEYEGDVYDFQAPPNFTMLSPFVTQDCVTSWSIERPLWEGVPIKSLADAAEVKPEAKWVMFHCYDGYTAPVPLEDAMMEDSIVALKMNGRPLTAEQGFPARPFMPHLYGWKSAKWLSKIEFIPEYADGYWEGYGYHERGDVNEEERFKGAKGQGGKHFARRAFGTA